MRRGVYQRHGRGERGTRDEPAKGAGAVVQDGPLSERWIGCAAQSLDLAAVSQGHQFSAASEINRSRRLSFVTGHSPQGAFFEEERLLAVLRSADAADVAGLPATVFDAVMSFSAGRQIDDIALLAFRHSGAPG